MPRVPSLLMSLALLSACGDKESYGESSDTDPTVSWEADADTDADTDSDTDADTDADTDTDVELIDCEVDLGTPESGRCEVIAGSAALVIRGMVLAPEAIYTGGEVVVDEAGLISCVGCDCSADPDYETASMITCPDGVVSPGLINPHDHITYGEGWPIDVGSTRYDHRHEWRAALSTPSNSSGLGEELVEARMVMGGVTSMVGSGQASGLVRNLDESGNEGLDLDKVDNQTFPLNDSNRSFKSDCGWDYRDDEREISRENAYLPHISEGINTFAAEEFRCTSTSFDGGQDYTESNAAHIHAIGLDAEGYYEMAREGTGLVWSPRSNISLYGVTAGVTTFATLGGSISLGTDWTYSGSTNSVRELACADEYNQAYLDGFFSDQELFEMVTVNGAWATGAEHLIGILEPGYVADISVFDGSVSPGYRAIIEAEVDGAVLVLRGGEALYGEAQILVDLGESCETIDVCGTEMAMCADREFGSSVDDILEATSSDYPMFSCDGPPVDEPTCLPARDGEFDGLSSDEDTDGDGLVDAEDNCPLIFNPIRPIDAGFQADVDGDGEGDACDLSPVGTDLDGDGVDNEADNCPRTANTDQSDLDEDGKGDACDWCPEQANPDTVCELESTQASIYDLRTGAVAAGVYAEVVDVVVTGVTSSGFTVQDPAANEDPAWSGLYVYLGSTPSVARGDVVTVTGELDEYYGWSQLSGGDVTVTEASGVADCDELSTALIDPVELTVAEATDESWEGVLVRLTDGTATDLAYDCSVDGSSCSDEDLWEIDDSTGVVVYDSNYECTDWTDQIGVLPVTGVMMYRFDRRRIMPRTTGDFGE